jgi:hypothetical protein
VRELGVFVIESGQKIHVAQFEWWLFGKRVFFGTMGVFGKKDQPRGAALLPHAQGGYGKKRHNGDEKQGEKTTKGRFHGCEMKCLEYNSQSAGFARANAGGG